MDAKLINKLLDEVDKLQEEKLNFEAEILNNSEKTDYDSVQSTFFLFKIAELRLAIEEIINLLNSIKPSNDDSL